MDMLAKRPADVKAETIGDALGNVEAEHCSILWLAQVEP